jgi:hypothetical protein
LIELPTRAPPTPPITVPVFARPRQEAEAAVGPAISGRAVSAAMAVVVMILRMFGLI